MDKYASLNYFGLMLSAIGGVGAVLIPGFQDYLNTTVNPHNSSDLTRYAVCLMVAGVGFMYGADVLEQKRKDRAAAMSALEEKLTQK